MSSVGLRAHAAVEVDLSDIGGGVFTVAPVTRSVQDKAAALDDAIKATMRLDEFGEVVEIADRDAYVEAVTTGLDLRLRTTVPKQAKASTVIRRAWRDDKITLDQLNHLLTDIAEQDRPT